MGLYKNTTGQQWIVFAFDRTTNQPKTGDAGNITANLRIDGGGADVVDDTNPTELEGGYYIFDLTQAETNGDMILIAPASGTTNIQVIGVPGAVFTHDPLTGEGAYTGTLIVDDGAGNGLEGVVVSATRGGVLKATGTTDSSGEITDWVLGAYTYTLAVRLAGYQPAADTIVVTGNAWTKTVSLTAISISAPSAASLCTVNFQVKLSDTAVSGAVCKAKLQGTNQASDGTILSNAESSDTTDAQGEAELELVRKDSITKGNGVYRIWIEIDGKPVASVETKIPNQSTIYFEDLL